VQRDAPHNRVIVLTWPGTLMLAIQARSFANYFYLQASNRNHPARFVQNKVAGTLFENKCEYTSTHPS
jgi:endo-1,3(4)-beta-glucanase